jgi:iron complex transport system permease protein
MTAIPTLRAAAPRRRIVVRARWWSARIPLHTVVVIALLGAGAFALVVVATGTGTYPVAPADVLGVLFGSNTGFDRVVVLEWRMPRALMALLVGAALGMSGAIFQALTRNPLGSPDIIGLNVGAYTGALAGIVIFGGGYYATASGALVGGLAASLVVYLLALRNGTLSGFRLIIIGIAVSAVLYSVNEWIIVKVDLHTAVTASVWQQGSLNGLSWAQAVPMAVCLAGVVAALVPMGLRLQLLQLGDDAAGGLGVHPGRARIGYFLVGVALIAVSAAAAGPISFVALAAPQLGRRLTGSAGVGLAPSAAMGGFLLLASDVIAQRAFAPDELPIGTVTVVFGGGYLIYLLVAEARRS